MTALFAKNSSPSSYSNSVMVTLNGRKSLNKSRETSERTNSAERPQVAAAYPMQIRVARQVDTNVDREVSVVPEWSQVRCGKLLYIYIILLTASSFQDESGNTTNTPKAASLDDDSDNLRLPSDSKPTPWTLNPQNDKNV